MKKSFLTLIFLFALCNILQAKEITYVEVDPITGDSIIRELKNFNVIQSVDGNGYLQMHASRPRDVWRVRLIRTDKAGDLIWQFDYLFMDSLSIRFSTIPFAICHNLDGDGYVVAGIWSRDFTYDNSGKVHPFYMEIDDLGQVIQAKRLMISSDTCFAPLKIKPSYPDQTYVVAGVSSDTLSDINFDFRAGRVCKISRNLSELPGAVEIKSSYASTPAIATRGSLFDALNNVEVVQEGSSYYYVISGAVTDDLYRVDPLSFYFGQYGRSVPYIAKTDTNLNIIWYQAGFVDANYDHSVMTDVVYDSSNNSLYAICMRPSNLNENISLEVRELDWSNGATVQSVFTTNSSGSAKFTNVDVHDYFFGNLVLSGDGLIAVGYSIEQPNNGVPPYNDKMDPFVIYFDKNDLSTITSSWYSSQETFGTLSLDFMQGYLGYRYPLTKADFYVNSQSLSNSPTQRASISPMIYFPEMAVFDTDSLAGFTQPRLEVIAGVQNYIDLFDSTWKHASLFNFRYQANCYDSTTEASPAPLIELYNRLVLDSVINSAQVIDTVKMRYDLSLKLDSCSISGATGSLKSADSKWYAFDYQNFQVSKVEALFKESQSIQPTSKVRLMGIYNMMGQELSTSTSLPTGFHLFRYELVDKTSTIPQENQMKVVLY